MTAKKTPPLPSKEQIADFIRESGGDVSKREIARAFSLSGDHRTYLKEMLRELADDGLVRKGGKRRGQAMGHRFSSGARRQGAVRAMIDAKPAGDQGICAAAPLQRGDSRTGRRAAAFFLCIAGPGGLRLRPEDEEPRDRGKP